MPYLCYPYDLRVIIMLSHVIPVVANGYLYVMS
jgi:hypothetical protein